MKNKAKTVIYSLSCNHIFHHFIVKKIVLAGLIIVMQVHSVEHSFMSTIKDIFNSIINNEQLKSRFLALANKVNTHMNREAKKDIQYLANQKDLQKNYVNSIVEVLQETPLQELSYIDPITGNQRCQSTSTQVALLYKKNKQDLTGEEKVIVTITAYLQNQYSSTYIKDTPIIIGLDSINNKEIDNRNLSLIENIGTVMKLKLLSGIDEKQLKEKIASSLQLISSKDLMIGSHLPTFNRVLQKIVGLYGDRNYNTKEEIHHIVPFYKTKKELNELDGIVYVVTILDEKNNVLEGQEVKILQPSHILTLIENRQGVVENCTVIDCSEDITFSHDRYRTSAYDIIPEDKLYHVIESNLINNNKGEEQYKILMENIKNKNVNYIGGNINILKNMTTLCFDHHVQLIDPLKNKANNLKDEALDQLYNNTLSYKQYSENRKKQGLLSVAFKVNSNNTLSIDRHLDHMGKDPNNNTLGGVRHVYVIKGKKSILD